VALDPVLPRSRRALLLGAAGGLAAAALGSITRPDRTLAANGDPVVQGQANNATTTTSLDNTDPAGAGLKTTESGNGTALLAVSGTTVVTPAAKIGVYGYANQDSAARGVYGKTGAGTGVWGNSDTGRGVFGQSTSGTGVDAKSTTGPAVQASNASTTKPAVTALNTSVTSKSAVQGAAGLAALPAPQAETGVEGVCNISVNSNGVYGGSTHGTGVWGNTQDGAGVAGLGYWGVFGSGAVGVLGDVDGGTGVQGWTGVAAAPAPAAHVGVLAGAENGRTALQVSGVSKFNRSGRASIAVGASSKKIIVPGGITTAAFGIATIQGNRAGFYVQAVTTATADSSITVYLNKAVTTSAITVGWIVLS